MRCKRDIVARIKIWKYRFQGMGWVGILPVLVWGMLIPLMFTSTLKHAGEFKDIAYTKSFWILEMLNIILCVFWQMFLMKDYVSGKSREIFESITGGWKRRDSIENFIIYIMLLSISMGFICIFSKNFVSYEIFLKDYISLVCETLFIQGIFTAVCLRLRNTLVPMIGVFILLLQQKQSIHLEYAWLWFINGSMRVSGTELMYVKYILGGIGIFLLLCVKKDYRANKY